jgi:hypothetical protein
MDPGQHDVSRHLANGHGLFVRKPACLSRRQPRFRRHRQDRRLV